MIPQYFALRIPTAHDFCVISACKLACARTQRKKIKAKLDSEINVRFLLNGHGNLYFYSIIIVCILSSLI